MPVNSGSILDEHKKCHHEHSEHTEDHFHMTHPDTEWESCLEHAQKIGLGVREYQLITLKEK